MAEGFLATSARKSTAFADVHIAVVALYSELRIAQARVADKNRGLFEPFRHFPAIYENPFQGLDFSELFIFVHAGLCLSLLGGLEQEIYCATWHGKGVGGDFVKDVYVGVKLRMTYCRFPAFSFHFVYSGCSRPRNTLAEAGTRLLWTVCASWTLPLLVELQ